MPRHHEKHYADRIGWLRAAVLGANDGIVSTASLLLGVVAAGAGPEAILLAGLAGLIAGAFSMAAGEYVSVSAQSDVEEADLERERIALEEDPEYELQELAEGLEARGVSEELALRVAREMTAHDALDAHAREELGLTDPGGSRPLQAAIASALAFAGGAGLPLAAVVATPDPWRNWTVIVISHVALIVLGAMGARLGGTPIWPAVLRVVFWGALAMAVTSAVGRLFGVMV